MHTTYSKIQSYTYLDLRDVDRVRVERLVGCSSSSHIRVVAFVERFAFGVFERCLGLSPSSEVLALDVRRLDVFFSAGSADL